MRHSYIDGPRRIRAPRATPRSRARFLPAIVALPAVAALWLTVGLPVLSQVTGAGAGNRESRNVFFSTEATAGGSGGSAGGASGPQTVAAATVSKQVLAAYHAEVAQARARAMSSGTIGTIGTTSAAPTRGCAPTCRRRSIRSRAQAIPARSASTSWASSPTSV